MEDLQRACGACTACCKTHMVQELGKPIGAWCTHCARGVGCLIYEKRPQGCIDFSCMWRLGVTGDPKEPPHKTGVVGDMQDLPQVGLTLILYEYKPDALQSSYARELRNTYLSADPPLPVICVPTKGTPSIILISGVHKQADHFTLNGRLLRVRVAHYVGNAMHVPQ